ncbi:unnamed protein product [Schistosoma mattheei]|uniref:PDZ domain-containing protein n=1 Tax=Schistosoma mattheei TaxID=31246 RepID=A0A3P7YPN8_9TREM|nr:unnamed protein product [Schistosoma mattheei]
MNKVRFGDKIQCINDIEVTSYTQAKQLIEETHPTVNFSFLDWSKHLSTGDKFTPLECD